jgi:hypothetical protein
MQWEREVSEKKQPFKIHFEKAKTKKRSIRRKGLLSGEKMRQVKLRKDFGGSFQARFAADAVVCWKQKIVATTVFFKLQSEIGRYGSGQVSPVKR